MTDTTRAHVLPGEALQQYTCKCGKPIVVKNAVAAAAFREYVATGKVDALCDECRREVGTTPKRNTR